MSARRDRNIRLPAPYLRRIWLDAGRVTDRAAYPFCLSYLRDDFELSFDRSITIIAGENGTGKSTLLEGIAVLAGYDEAGGGKGYMPVDHSKAIEKMGGQLSKALRAAWLPKITNGWFFRAESFFSVARYQDEVNMEYGGTPPDYLSHSHGEGFLRFFEERCQEQGIFIFDEPESALSPARQIEFLKLMSRMDAAKLPDHHGHALADADGLSQCAPAAAFEIWPGAGDHRRDGSLQGHARILRRSGGVRAIGNGEIVRGALIWPNLATAKLVYSAASLAPPFRDLPIFASTGARNLPV